MRGAMNLPAHSFYPSRKILYQLCRQAGIKKVIFYCGEGTPASSYYLAIDCPADKSGLIPPQAHLLAEARAALRGCRTMCRRSVATWSPS